MSVDFQRSDYAKALPDWEMVDTLCEGESAVKEAGKTLLPDPVVATGETQRELDAIYQRYLQRALYINIVGRTRSSLIGSVFRKAPRLTIPTNLAYMATDCDGSGLSIYQQSQKALEDVLTTGRCAVLVDFPQTDGAVSIADMNAGLVRANICHYDAEDIINWQHTRIGGKSVLSRVVLSENADTVDGFVTQKVKQLRELAIEDGSYCVRLWRQNKNKDWEPVSEAFPTMANGQPWASIPFSFIGAVNNDSSIDSAPLFDLACVNRKHYQLGADWYNALYYAGQPQPVISGLTEDWRDWLEKNGVVVGSRAPFLLPAGANFTYATVSADSAIQKELADLVQTMAMLGARLVQPGEAVKTATQSSGEQEVSHSIVSLAAENVSDAYTQALLWAQMFMGGAGAVDYRLSNDLTVIAWDAQMLAAIVGAWQSGTMPKSDAIRFLQRIGLIDGEKTIEQVMDELEGAGLSL